MLNNNTNKILVVKKKVKNFQKKRERERERIKNWSTGFVYNILERENAIFLLLNHLTISRSDYN